MKRLFVLFLWILMHFAPDSTLVIAAREGDVPQMRALLAQGADPNEPSGTNQWTPLMHAIHKNQLASVAALLDGHANPNLASLSGETPLMMAAGYGQAAIVRLLLARGAKPNITDRIGDTALDYALTGTSDIDDFTLFHCQDEAARALIAAGAHANSRSIRFARLKGCKAR